MTDRYILKLVEMYHILFLYAGIIELSIVGNQKQLTNISSSDFKNFGMLTSTYENDNEKGDHERKESTNTQEISNGNSVCQASSLYCF